MSQAAGDFTYRTRGTFDLHSPESIKRCLRLVAFNTSAAPMCSGRVSAHVGEGVDLWLMHVTFSPPLQARDLPSPNVAAKT